MGKTHLQLVSSTQSKSDSYANSIARLLITRKRSGSTQTTLMDFITEATPIVTKVTMSERLRITRQESNWTPINSRLWGQRCWSRAVVGKQLQAALDDCNKANSLSPKISQIFAYRGFVYLKLGQFDKALADYDAAFSLTKIPDHADWLYGRGVRVLGRRQIRGAWT